MSERISVLFAMDAVTLPEPQREALRVQTAQWVEVSAVGARQMIAALIDPALLETLRLALAPTNPILIGAWRPDGSALDPEAYPFAAAEYLALMPDEVSYDADGNEVSRTPPTAPAQIHNWSGWEDKEM